MPIFYECQRCTACCRWPGDVRLRHGELGRLAAFKSLTEHEVIQHFMRLTADGGGLALAEKGNGECVFLDERLLGAAGEASAMPRVSEPLELPGIRKNLSRHFARFRRATSAVNREDRERKLAQRPGYARSQQSHVLPYDRCKIQDKCKRQPELMSMPPRQYRAATRQAGSKGA